MNDLKTGDQAMLGDEVVTIHVTTKEVSCLIEHSDGSFSRVGASALLPLDEPKMRSVTASLHSFFRQGEKRKAVLK
jgi:hypothetical protein